MSRLSVKIDGQIFEVVLSPLDRSKTTLEATVNGQKVTVAVPELSSLDELDCITVDGRPHEVEIDRQLRWMRAGTTMHFLEVRDMEALVSRPISGDGRVKAPIPGLISRVFVDLGDQVKSGQPLLVLEAMKMENTIVAPRPGVVAAIGAAVGDIVTLGQILMEIISG